MMKFKQPRICFDPILYKIAKREETKQQSASRMRKRDLSNLTMICNAIETKGLPDHLVCKKLSNELGFGIFLHPEAMPINRGDIIGPYSGDLIIAPQNAPGDSCYVFSLMTDLYLTKSEQKYVDEKASFRPNRLYSLDIDAENNGNFIRFINHSEKPNIAAELFSVPKNSLGLSSSPIEVFYIAKKTIYPGDQLLICYEAGDNSYWSNLNIKPTPMTPKTFRLEKNLRITKN